MVEIGLRRIFVPGTEPSSGLQVDPAYRAWLKSKPVPGEVFVDTGEASAEDNHKLRWSPSEAQRTRMIDAIGREATRVQGLCEGDSQKAEDYETTVSEYVRKTLKDAHVDPKTLHLPDSWRSAGDGQG